MICNNQYLLLNASKYICSRSHSSNTQKISSMTIYPVAQLIEHCTPVATLRVRVSLLSISDSYVLMGWRANGGSSRGQLRSRSVPSRQLSGQPSLSNFQSAVVPNPLTGTDRVWLLSTRQVLDTPFSEYPDFTADSGVRACATSSMFSVISESGNLSIRTFEPIIHITMYLHFINTLS